VALRRARLERLSWRFFAALVAIFFAWTNIHSNFVIGLGVVFLWLANENLLSLRAGRILWKESLAVAGACVGATLLNPYGAERLLIPFWQGADPGSTTLSLEMFPITEFNNPLGILIVAAALLTALSAGVSRAVPAWLLLFAALSFFLAIEHRRFINLAAVSLLFVCAERVVAPGAETREDFLPWAFLKTFGLASLCLITLFLDAFNVAGVYSDLRLSRPFATEAGRFAGPLVAAETASAPQPVLCGHTEGSYLSFDPDRRLRPLLDSGMSHFSDDAKRYFFFVWNEPEAFNLALSDLHVNIVIIERDTLPWIAVLGRRPDWKLVDCTETGMLWRRCPPGTNAMAPEDREKISRTIEAMKREGNITGAFWYSTLLDEPRASLALLARGIGPIWNDSIFNFLACWIDTQPVGVIEQYLAERPAPSLFTAMLAGRVSEETQAAMTRSAPPGAIDWRWKLVEIRAKINAKDWPGARAILETISPRPVASTAYYSDWAKIDQSPSPPRAQLDAFERWQIWDGESRAFVEAMSARLNARIAYLGM
jgi:hypothetical protein